MTSFVLVAVARPLAIRHDAQHLKARLRLADLDKNQPRLPVLDAALDLENVTSSRLLDKLLPPRQRPLADGPSSPIPEATVLSWTTGT